MMMEEDNKTRIKKSQIPSFPPKKKEMEKETQMTTKITHRLCLRGGGGLSFPLSFIDSFMNKDDIKHIAFPFSDGRSVLFV